MNHSSKREAGQSLIIIVFALIGLVGFLALVVDAGNTYLQRRRVQNATDVASQAGALAWAQNKNNGNIISQVDHYLDYNYNPKTPIHSKMQYYFVAQTPSGGTVIDTHTIASYGNSNVITQVTTGGYTNIPVVGVQVQSQAGGVSFNTFFAGVLGVKQLSTGGQSAAFAKCGACSTSNIFPVAINIDRFQKDQSSGAYQMPWGVSQQLWENYSSNNGGFAWLNWDSATAPSASNLATNIGDLTKSGTWRITDTVRADWSSSFMSSLSSQITNKYVTPKVPVTIVVFDKRCKNQDCTQTTGLNTVRIAGYVRFLITDVLRDGTTNRYYFRGLFQEWVDPSAEGGCNDFGVCSVRLRPPINPVRTVAGTVKYQKITPTTAFVPITTHVPIDVVNVLDLSGSMTGSYSGSSSKLAAAKTALQNFNTNMKTNLGDRVALVTYPQDPFTTGTKYDVNPQNKQGCSSVDDYRTYYLPQLRHALTSNVTAVNNTITGLGANGGTPIAGGLSLGTSTVLGAGHTSDHVAVMIIASDGLANMTNNGQWTGFQGSDYSSPVCNNQAIQDAIGQANAAKADNNGDGQPDVIIFSIAVGDEFDEATMRAIASPDTMPGVNNGHYFRVTSASAMNDIYTKISQRIDSIETELCQTILTEAFVPRNVKVTLTSASKTYVTYTTDAGEFVVPNVDAGTYTITVEGFTSNGYTYGGSGSIYTDGVGGPQVSTPQVIAGVGSGTYRTDVFLKVTCDVGCGGCR